MIESIRDRENLKGSSITLHAHGDGTYHTNAGEYGGKRVEHPSIGHALMHIAKQHSEGDHLHVHSTDSGITTHQVMAGGKVQGPAQHSGIRSVKQAVSKFVDEGEEDY